MTQIVVDIPPNLYQRIEIKRSICNKPNKNVVINEIIKKYFELFPDEGDFTHVKTTFRNGKIIDETFRNDKEHMKLVSKEEMR